ncbi:hypothetical protein [Parabacteroides sp. FAFU027]|uniref:hypothetical protein n=1 Tax=Parabacteroides sp. FAFU027 TaxID=2922715 RepID=UPI001FAF667A|nr:hypothetical protein [Parabacteroides sp. FAFU027]
MKKILLSVFVTLLCVSSSFALDLPTGYVSIYDLNKETEVCPHEVAAGTSFQFVGPASGWGALQDHDLSNYKEMVFKMTFDAADGGNQVVIRFAINGGAKDPLKVTLPTDSSTLTVVVPLEQYKDANGFIGLGGIVFYNGSSHWSFTYDGTPSNTPVTLNYIALKTQSTSSGVTTTKAENPDAPVNVYSIAGDLIRKAVKQSEAINGLQPGLYIVNNQKVCVLK